MQDTKRLKDEEIIGLAAAFILHVALIGILIFRPPTPPVAMPKQESITVSLAEDVGITSAAPDPVRESREAQAPEFAEVPAPPVMEPVPVPLPQPVQTRAPKPDPKPSARPSPKPTAKPTSKPTAKPTAKPTSKPDTRERRRPDRETTQSTTSRSTPTRTNTAQNTTQRSGASKIGDDFLKGAGSSATSTETRAVAATIGPRERATVAQAIARQLKPHWTAPQGVDVDQLVTIIAFDLNPDGSLKGVPRFVSQSGVNAANRPQAERHKELAIRAVRLAAPFDLPAEYYDAWKKISNARFDRNL